MYQLPSTFTFWKNLKHHQSINVLRTQERERALEGIQNSLKALFVRAVMEIPPEKLNKQTLHIWFEFAHMCNLIFLFKTNQRNWKNDFIWNRKIVRDFWWILNLTILIGICLEVCYELKIYWSCQQFFLCIWNMFLAWKE